MTITIDASPELMEAITREAAREGVTPQEYTLKAVAERTAVQNGNGFLFHPVTPPLAGSD